MVGTRGSSRQGGYSYLKYEAGPEEPSPEANGDSAVSTEAHHLARVSPDTETKAIRVPSGAPPGTEMEIQVDDGVRVVVEIPPGAQQGTVPTPIYGKSSGR